MGRAYMIDDKAWPGVTTIIDAYTDKSSALIPWAVNCALDYVGSFIQVDEDGYTNDDSVLEVLKKARFQWRSVSQAAKDIGSEVHNAIEKYILRGKVTHGMSKEAKSSFKAFMDWETENKITWLCSEERLLSEKYGYAGTVDAIAHFGAGDYEGEIHVIDFKSSKGFYDGYDLQIAAYRQAIVENETCFNPEILDTASFITLEAGLAPITLGKDEPIPIHGMGILRLDKETGLPEYKDYSKNYQRHLDTFLLMLNLYYTHKSRRLKNNPFVEKNKELYG